MLTTIQDHINSIKKSMEKLGPKKGIVWIKQQQDRINMLKDYQ